MWKEDKAPINLNVNNVVPDSQSRAAMYDESVVEDERRIQ